MRVVIVFNHPYEGSFCAAILHAVVQGLARGGHTADVIHLDQDGFNPVMTAADLLAFTRRQPVDPQVLAYQQRLQQADHLVLIFPIWWELMPALTKGFIDKVIFPGLAYDYAPQDRMRRKLERLRGVTVITTMNTPSFFYWLLFGNPIRKALLLGTFGKIDFPNRR
jgi:putative NADPH-quinone reductase